MKAAFSGRPISAALGIPLLALVAWVAPAAAAEVVVPSHAERPTDLDVKRRVALELPGCPTDFDGAVRRIVGVEIGDLLIEPGQPLSADDDRLSIACDRGLAKIGAIAAAGAHSPARVERILSLTAFPGDAAPRASALAGIEALATLSPTVRERLATRSRAAQPGALAPTQTHVDGNPTPAVVLQPMSPPADASLTVTLSGTWRWFPVAQGISAWGGRFAVDRNLATRFNLGLDLEAAAGGRRLAAGDFDGVLVSAGALVGLRGGGTDLASVLAVGVRGGVVRLVGHPADTANLVGDSAILPWAGPIVSARILTARGRWVVGVTMEVGLTVLSAQGKANADTALAVDGAWLAVAVGGGIRR